jgi:glycosyltransferase involved in cell wall biosynthesis
LVPPERITVIWNGVDTREFSPDVDGSAVRREWNVAEGECLVGCVARITPWKGQHLVLEAFAELVKHNQSLRLVLVGTPLFDNDNYLQQLHEYVRAHNLEPYVTFAGFRWDLPEVLAALDVFVHSAVEKDSSPLSVVSAMAAGKAIVCPRIDGISELFQDGNDALLFTPGSASELGQQLGRVVADRDLARGLGLRAREKAVSQFGLDVFAGKCEVIFNQVLHRGGKLE